MNIKDTKNKHKILDIVKYTFGFDGYSYKRFRDSLFFDRDIAPEYKNIIGEDLRARFQLGDKFIDKFEEHFKESDRGYTYFRNIFTHFVGTYNIGYNEYYKNKKQIGSNEVKLSKLIKKFYLYENGDTIDLINSFFTHILSRESRRERFISFLQENFPILNDSNENIEMNHIGYYAQEFPIETHVLKLFFHTNIEDYIKKKEDYTLKLDDEKMGIVLDQIIKMSNEVIGEMKLPRSENLELVLSLNFADWFLASTGEEWSSCLDLGRDGEVFWQGMPTLIGDKNRALVYITDGRKKTFKGIEVDRIISRSWVLLMRSKTDNITHFHFIKEYPGNFGLKDIAEKTIGKRFMSTQDFSDLGYPLKKVVGRYYIEMLYNTDGLGNKYYSTIYMDTTKIKLAKKNKARYNYGSYGYYKISGSGVSNFILGGDTFNFEPDNFPDLPTLLDEGSNIIDYVS